MYPLASTAGLRKNNVQVELVVGILPAHSRIHIVDGTLVKNATSIRPEHIAFVCIAEGLLLITPPDAGIPATADTSTGLRRIGAFGAIGQMCQVVDALCDTVGVGEVTPALDLLASCVVLVLILERSILRLRHEAGRVMSSLDLSHLVNDVLDCAREDMVFGEVLESAPLDVAHRVTARNL